MTSLVLLLAVIEGENEIGLIMEGRFEEAAGAAIVVSEVETLDPDSGTETNVTS
jgi:hypothetical protein